MKVLLLLTALCAVVLASPTRNCREVGNFPGTSPDTGTSGYDPLFQPPLVGNGEPQPRQFQWGSITEKPPPTREGRLKKPYAFQRGPNQPERKPFFKGGARSLAQPDQAREARFDYKGGKSQSDQLGAAKSSSQPRLTRGVPSEPQPFQAREAKRGLKHGFQPVPDFKPFNKGDARNLAQPDQAREARKGWNFSDDVTYNGHRGHKGAQADQAREARLYGFSELFKGDAKNPAR